MTDRGFYWTEHDRRPEGPQSDRVRPEPPFDLADPVRLRAYRQALTDKALLLPRGSSRRREIEKQLSKITGQLLRLEVREGR